MKFVRFIKKNIMLFARSFSLKDYFTSFGMDVLGVAIFFLAMLLFSIPVQNVMSDLEAIEPQLSDPGNVDPVLLSSIQSSLATVFIVFIALFLATVAILSATRLFLWRRITKSKSPSEKWTKRFGRYVRHYFVSLFGVIIFVVLPLFIIVLNVEALSVFITPQQIRALSIMLTVLFFIYVHLSAVFNHIYARKSKVFASLKETLNVGIMNIGYFGIPYLIILLISLVLTLIFSLLMRLPPLVYVISYSIIITLYISLIRVYVNKLLFVLCKKFAKM